MTAQIGDVRSLHLAVRDLDRSRAFYTRAWGLQQVSERDGSSYLRGRGTEHHILQLSPGDVPGLRGITFKSLDRAALERFGEQVADRTGQPVAGPVPLSPEAGGGVGLHLVSPDGLSLCFSAEVARHPAELADRTVPERLTHVVVNSGDVERQLRFYIEDLGFELTDNTDRQYFLRSGVDHHSVAVALGTGPSLNHAAFETADFDSQMRASGRVVDYGTPIEWGPGRHGPGNNIFCYFVDPDGFAVEYTTEVAKLLGNHEANDANYWNSRPRRPCVWGIAGRPSPRMTDAFAGRLVA